jgi:hypothetical protein
MASSPTPHAHQGSPWRRRLLVSGIVLASGAFIWSRLPKGSFPTDLSRIGQGQPALVLSVDSNYMAGAEMMTVLNGLRPEFAGSVQFLVASIGLPEGRAFVDQHQTQDGSIVLFDARGERVAVLHGPRTQDELRQRLKQAFGPQ